MVTDKASHTSTAPDAREGMPAVDWTVLRERLRSQGLLVDVHAGADAPSAKSVVIEHLTQDSRTVEPGGGFVAVRGTEADGHDYVDAAIRNGARLIVTEADVETTATGTAEARFVQVTDTRVALAEMGAALYGDPSKALQLIGVTGTNGKTTVAYLANHVLETTGEKTGLLSTVDVRTGRDTTSASLTTPGPLELHRTLREMVDQGCTTCAMEVSSHALDQDRVHGLDFDVAVFTNITADHLDYHGTFLAYRLAKKRLFDELGSDATALYNADDEAGAEMVDDTAATTWSFALEHDADIRPRVLESTVEGLRLEIAGRKRAFRLAGRFNAYNLAATYGVGRSLDLDPDTVLDALADAQPVPGRFERLSFQDGRTVIVDYAHTPDALDTVLSAVRETMPQDATLWCVFGCGGDRDTTKRGTMGRIAEQAADRVIVTSDNPRTEDPEAIMNDIRRGVSQPETVEWIVDREDAIRRAAEASAPPDVVVIAGKGHETYQTIGTEKRPFDDREAARRYFSR